MTESRALMLLGDNTKNGKIPEQGEITTFFFVALLGKGLVLIHINRISILNQYIIFFRKKL